MGYKNSLELEADLRDVLPKNINLSVNRNIDDDFIIRVNDHEFIFDHQWYLDEFQYIVNEILNVLKSDYLFIWWKQ